MAALLNRFHPPLLRPPKALFDTYAPSFDKSLKGLDYSVPEALREVLGGMKPRYREVFDAGCGTGLLGPLFRDISGTVQYSSTA